MKKIYVIHENDSWVEPLRDAFGARRLPFEEWFVHEGLTALDTAPPEGVFYNRMSASSHTRGHRYSPEATSVVLAWLERHGRRVLNGSRALQLEVNKAAQHAALNAAGITTPRTIAAVGPLAIVQAAETFTPAPVIVKPNRGGTGHGVTFLETPGAVRAHVNNGAFVESLDGVTLVQQAITSPDQFIVRAEFIGGRFFYAVKVETGGSFELCPADPCAVRNGDGSGGEEPSFTIVERFDTALVAQAESFLAANGIDIGAIEFITDEHGATFAYDVNTNTNYNSIAEARAGRYGMQEVAEVLGRELERL